MFGIYLIMYGAIIGASADGEAGMMLAFAPIWLAIDFLLRFIVQTTPGMMVKPYILQPISRYTAIECFLISSQVSGYNFLWLAMFIPYSIIILIAGAGFWAVDHPGNSDVCPALHTTLFQNERENLLVDDGHL